MAHSRREKYRLTSKGGTSQIQCEFLREISPLIRAKVDRDTHGNFAFKCSYAEVDGEPRNVYKDPITDKGKTLKRGLPSLIRPFDTTPGFRTYKNSYSQKEDGLDEKKHDTTAE